MPITVPSRPMSGEIDAMVPSVLMNRSSSCTTCRPVSSMIWLITARSRCRLARPAARIFPSGEFCCKAWMCLSVIWRCSTHFQTFSVSSAGTTRRDWSVQMRSRKMAAATIEARMIGTMTMPPAFTISNIGFDALGQAVLGANTSRIHPGRLCDGSRSFLRPSGRAIGMFRPPADRQCSAA